MDQTHRFKLWYGSILLGSIDDAFVSDGTWFGTLVLSSGLRSTDAVANRILEFISFCEDWNERTRNLPEPPDPREFDAFADVIDSGLWAIENDEGNRHPIVEAPVFFSGHEVTWT